MEYSTQGNGKMELAMERVNADFPAVQFVKVDSETGVSKTFEDGYTRRLAMASDESVVCGLDNTRKNSKSQ
jgi:hypothetical protein